MTNNGEGYVQVGVDVDDQSFAQLNTSVNNSASNLNKLTKANIAVADSAEQAGSSLKRAFASVKSNIDEDVTSIQALREQLTGAAEDAGKAQQKSSSGNAGISGLRRTGSALTQLGLGDIGRPVQIAGDIQQVTKEFSKVGDATKTLIPALAGVDAGLVGTVTVLAPVAVALAGIAAVGAIWNSQLEEGKKQQEEATTSVTTYYQAIQNGTTASIAAQKAKAQSDLDTANATLTALKQQRADAFKAQQEFSGGLGDLGARIRTAAGALSTYDSAIADQEKKIPALKGAVDGLTAAYGSQIVKANDLADATLKLADQNAQTQIDSYKLIREGTVNQVQEIINSNRDKLQAYTAELTTLQAVKNPNDDVKKRIQELYDQLNILSLSSANLTQNVLPLVDAREKETQAAKDLDKQLKEGQKLRDEIKQKEVDIVKKYNESVQSAEDTAAQARIDANQKLQDALVAAAQKAVDDATKALDQLNQKEADNLTSLTRDQDKITRDANDQQINDQIKAQRQERDDLQQHLDNLKQIRDRDASRERDDLLNRNFRDLFALKEQKSQDITNENQRFVSQKQQREQALQDEQSDQARAIQVQRRERLISYQQANEDAVKQYNAELIAAQVAKVKAIELAQQANQRELTQLRTNLVNKETLLRQGAVNELQLVTQTEAAKQQIFQNYLSQAQQMLGQTTSAPAFTGQTAPKYMAEGGPLMAGQAAIVNDGRYRESFNNSMFPPGLGLFIPAQSGSINPKGGAASSVTLAPVFQITGVDAKQVSDIATAKMRQLIKETLL